jgi:hypothetical protein
MCWRARHPTWSRRTTCAGCTRLHSTTHIRDEGKSQMREGRREYLPCFFKVSAKMGTVELTGLLITKKAALGQDLAQASAKPFTIEALIPSKSYRVIPGCRCEPRHTHKRKFKRSIKSNVPAVTKTISLPVRAAANSSFPVYPVTLAFVEQ